jgi:hypothetical protein
VAEDGHAGRGTGLTAPGARPRPVSASDLMVARASPAWVISTQAGGPGRGVAQERVAISGIARGWPGWPHLCGDLGVVREFGGTSTSTWEQSVAGTGVVGYGGDGRPAAQGELGALGQMNTGRRGIC